MKQCDKKSLLTLCLGAAGMSLRLLQNMTGIEPGTGLPIPGSIPGILLPVLLAMKALIFLCLFLTAVSNGLLSIVSSLLGMTALVSIFLIPIKSALILFVSAWLISPAGLPLAAQKLLEVLYVGCERMQDWVMG